MGPEQQAKSGVAEMCRAALLANIASLNLGLGRKRTLLMVQPHFFYLLGNRQRSELDNKIRFWFYHYSLNKYHLSSNPIPLRGPI